MPYYGHTNYWETPDPEGLDQEPVLCEQCEERPYLAIHQGQRLCDECLSAVPEVQLETVLAQSVGRR